MQKLYKSAGEFTKTGSAQNFSERSLFPLSATRIHTRGKLNCCRLIPFLSPDAMDFSFCYAVFSVFTFFSFLPVFGCFQAYFGHLSTQKIPVVLFP